MNQVSLNLFAAIIVAAGVLSARAGAQAGPAKLTVTSTAFKRGETIPAVYTADGRNVSPPLAWTGAPAGTREFALILDDPDAPTPQPFVHWVIYKIPGAATGLPEAVPMGATVKAEALTGAIQGATGFSAFARRGGRRPIPATGAPRRRAANRTIIISRSTR